jgi:hypothetical protein
MPLPSTYVPIATQTLTAITATPTFTNIPQGYTDLVISVEAGITGDFQFRINGDSGTNYSTTWIVGSSTTATSVRVSNDNKIYLNYGSNSTGRLIYIYLLNYSNTTIQKPTLVKTGHASGAVEISAGTWRNTAAINSITFSGVNSYPVGATFTIYGIKAA